MKFYFRLTFYFQENRCLNCIAAILHHGPTRFRGHYTCYLHQESKWLLVDDSTAMWQQSLPNDLADVYLLLFSLTGLPILSVKPYLKNIPMEGGIMLLEPP